MKAKEGIVSIISSFYMLLRPVVFLFFRHERYKLQSEDRANLGRVTCLLANIASAPKSVEPTWLASSTEDSLYVFRPVC